MGVIDMAKSNAPRSGYLSFTRLQTEKFIFFVLINLIMDFLSFFTIFMGDA
jgi:hypothetical protein